MYRPFYVFLALRYLKSSASKGFISFITLISILGITIGVAALITVISVMNGFQSAIQAKLLKATPHLEILAALNNKDAAAVKASIFKEFDSIKLIEPSLQRQVLIDSGIDVSGVLLKGISANYLKAFNPSMLSDEVFDSGFNVVIGKQLAQKLGVFPGDKIKIILPGTRVLGQSVPRVKSFVVSGIFDLNYWSNSKVAFVNIKSLAKLANQNDSIDQFDIKLHDPMLAPMVNKQLTAKGYNYVVDWTEKQKDFFDTMKLERKVMYIILSLIVAVAAFNLLASLMMLVKEKYKQIAILQTIGASKKQILLIFLLQGVFIGIFGIALGISLGITLATYAPVIVDWLSSYFGHNLINQNVYLVDSLPVEIHNIDLFNIGVITLILSIIATIYPAISAAKVAPSEALKYD